MGIKVGCRAKSECNRQSLQSVCGRGEFVCVSGDWGVGVVVVGELEFVDIDTDGIVYLFWPRLDFQCLTCCNPHSVHSTPRVAQTSHWCFSRTAMLPPLSLPPPHTWQGQHSEVSMAGRGTKGQPRVLSNSLGPPHTDTQADHFKGAP